MKRHPFDPFSFVFGISFTALGSVLLNSNIDFADISGPWMLPLPLIFVGLLLGAVAVSRLERKPGVLGSSELGDHHEDHEEEPAGFDVRDEDDPLEDRK